MVRKIKIKHKPVERVVITPTPVGQRRGINPRLLFLQERENRLELPEPRHINLRST